jgi:hypothetical protein
MWEGVARSNNPVDLARRKTGGASTTTCRSSWRCCACWHSEPKPPSTHTQTHKHTLLHTYSLSLPTQSAYLDLSFAAVCPIRKEKLLPLVAEAKRKATARLEKTAKSAKAQ